MLRTALLTTLALTSCGFDSGSNVSSSSSSSSSDTGLSTSGIEPTTVSATLGTQSGTGTSTGTADTTGGSSSSETDPDTGTSETTGASLWGPFEDILPVDGVNDMFAADDDPTLSSDLLEIYFNSTRLGQEDIFVARRASLEDPFDAAEYVAELSSPFIDTVPELSPDGLVMTLSNNQPAGAGNFDVFVSTRDDLESLWSSPVPIEELNTIDGDGSLSMTEDGLSAVLCLNALARNDYQLFTTTRPALDEPWEVPTVIDALLSRGRDCSPWLSPDGSELWWGSNRPRPIEDTNVYRVAMVDGAPDGEIEEIVELSTDFTDDDPWLSPDGSVIVFSSDRDGNLDLYTARRELL